MDPDDDNIWPRAVTSVGAVSAATSKWLSGDIPMPTTIPSIPHAPTSVSAENGNSPFPPDATKKILSVKKKVKALFINDVYTNLVKKCRATGQIEPSLHNIVIAGGVFPSLLLKENINDLDVFVLNATDQNTISVKAYLQDLVFFDADSFKDSDSYDKKGSVSVLNANIIRTLSATRACSDDDDAYLGLKIQFVLTKYKTREELMAHFDFEHCKVNYTPFNDKLYITPKTYHAIINKQLIIASVTAPQSYRIKKFEDRGWKWQPKP